LTAKRANGLSFVPFVHLPGDITCYGASDYAVTEGGGDYTEHGIFAVDPLGTVYIIDWWRGQTVTDIWIERQYQRYSEVQK
jgi:hypothetical protein